MRIAISGVSRGIGEGLARGRCTAATPFWALGGRKQHGDSSADGFEFFECDMAKPLNKPPRHVRGLSDAAHVLCAMPRRSPTEPEASNIFIMRSPKIRRSIPSRRSSWHDR